MVLQQELQEFIFDKMNASNKSFIIGRLTDNPDTNTNELDDVVVTIPNVELSVTRTGNLFTIRGELDESKANGETLNAINVTMDSYSTDISKHTDIEKTDLIVLQYSTQFIHVID